MAVYAPTASESTQANVPSSWNRLRQLAAVRLDKPLALSVYLDLDPRETSTIPDLATRVNALADETAKLVRAQAAKLEHDEAAALKTAQERLADYLSSFDHGDHPGRHVHGLAVFASPGLLEPVLLPDTVADKVCLEPAFHLSPLVAQASGREGLVVFVSREQGRVYLTRGGSVRELDDLTEAVHSQHDQGGWSQARYERSIDNEVRDHLKLVAAALGELSRQERRPLALVGTEELKGDFLRRLEHESPETAGLVAGWAVAEAHTGGEGLRQVAEPVFAEWWARQEAELVDSWQEAVGKGARGTGGWADTLAAASDGRVEVLLYEDSPGRVKMTSAYECPTCGRGAASSGPCPLDGGTMRQVENAADLAIRETLRYGGKVWALRYDPRLVAVEGVGALLRF